MKIKTQRRAKYFSGGTVLLSVCVLLAGLAAATAAQASSFIFEPNVVTMQVGKTFALPVVIDPTGFPQYTVRFYITFPPDLLEVTSFDFGPNWLAVPQPGYDSLDNQRGELIKTAGFPRGFSAPVSFGTITFRATGPGDGAIAVGPQSFVLDAKNSNTLESRPQVRVIAAEGSAPKAESVEQLPNLPPTGEKNIFDVSLVPEQKTSRPSIAFFLLLFAAAALLGIIGRFVVVWFRRRSFMQKMKHDKDLKN
jgi:hypothetical protein